MRTPSVWRPPVSAGGRLDAGAQRQGQRQRSGPELRRQPLGGRTDHDEQVDLVQAVDQQRDPLLARAPLGLDQRVERLRERQHGEAVHGFGGQPDDAAGEQRLRRRVEGFGVVGGQDLGHGQATGRGGRISATRG